MTWWNVFVGVFFVITVTYLWIRERLRTTAMRRLARRLGFKYLGKTKLPEALSLYGTVFNHAWHIENQMEGFRGRTHIVAFDCQVGKGIGEAQRTVIAARASETIFAGLPAGSPLTTATSVAWTILYEPFGDASRNAALMPVHELAARIESIPMAR